MKIIRNRFIPFGGFAAINLFGIIFARKEVAITLRLVNHESIHTAQMKELGYLFFYIFYVLEWIYRLFLPGNAYRNISFEKEAYRNDFNLNYLKGERRPFAMWRK